MDLGVTGNRWVDIIGTVAITLTALGVIWRKLLKPMVEGVKAVIRGVATFERVAPVLVGIGEQFQPNGGGSLRDVVDRIETSLDQRGRKLDELYDYAHTWRHEQSGQIAGLTVRDEAITRRLDQLSASDTVKIQKLDDLSAKVDPMPAKLDEIAASTAPSPDPGMES